MHACKMIEQDQCPEVGSEIELIETGSNFVVGESFKTFEDLDKKLKEQN